MASAAAPITASGAAITGVLPSPPQASTAMRVSYSVTLECTQLGNQAVFRLRFTWRARALAGKGHHVPQPGEPSHRSRAQLASSAHPRAQLARAVQPYADTTRRSSTASHSPEPRPPRARSVTSRSLEPACAARPAGAALCRHPDAIISRLYTAPSPRPPRARSVTALSLELSWLVWTRSRSQVVEAAIAGRAVRFSYSAGLTLPGVEWRRCWL